MKSEIKSFSQQTAHTRYRNSQSRPEYTVNQADLTLEIKRQTGIVPHIHFSFEIDSAPHHKFDACDHAAADHTFFPHGNSDKTFENSVKNDKAESACQNHCPMRIFPPDDFDQPVGDSSDGKQCQIAV